MHWVVQESSDLASTILYPTAWLWPVASSLWWRSPPSGHARWFERLLSELKFELRIGDAAEIRTKRVRKQKTDRQDAQLILKLMLEDRFPQIWCRAGRIAICGSCCGTDIGWYRRARVS